MKETNDLFLKNEAIEGLPGLTVTIKHFCRSEMGEWVFTQPGKQTKLGL